MQILLACAKIMHDSTPIQPQQSSVPYFKEDVARFAMELAQWQTDDFANKLNCSKQIAATNKARYLHFFDEGEQLPAILAYNGQAYKCLDAQSFSNKDYSFAQNHLWITSFLYGLLRPLDYIHPYRLEGKVSLEATEGQTMFAYWKPYLTRLLIDAVKADDGILIHLATEEMQHLFCWQQVMAQVKVINPQFYVIKNGKPKVVTMYAKSCRGAMTRYIIRHQLSHADQLKEFEYEGFVYSPEMSTPTTPCFII